MPTATAVDAAPLRRLRATTGLVVAVAAIRILAKGWVTSLYLEPAHHLTYAGLGWVRPLPSAALHGLVVGLAVAGLVLASGRARRTSALAVAAGFAYLEALDAALYLNHYWFLILLGLWLAVLPDGRSGGPAGPGTVPGWAVLAARFQVGVVYVFAGLAKLNPDWLAGRPLDLWLTDRREIWLVGPLLAAPWFAVAAAWLAAAFDLSIVGWLAWRRSRPWAYAVLVGFHVVTGLLFPIGMFPLVMSASALVFFGGRAVEATPPAPSPSPSPRWSEVSHASVRVAVVALVALEVALPLRHLAIGSNVRWSDEGGSLAWRVMLSEKVGRLRFVVRDPATGEEWDVDPELVLTDWQTTQAAIRPDLVHATALLVADEFAEDHGVVEVRAESWVSWNGRPPARLVDPTIDLAAAPRNRWDASWVVAAPG